MKKSFLLQAALMVIIFGVLNFSKSEAQGHHWGDHHGAWPDSLNIITVSGIAMVDSTFMHPLYYLDEDGDGTADYFLAFGPWWYEPSSGATRPAHEDSITVEGALQQHDSLSVVVVFKINGLEWRQPIETGHHGWDPYSFWTDTLTTVSVSGTALVDTTYYYFHYYLDEDGDGIPEYQLNFGPPWYEPRQGRGAVRPAEGDRVDIVGGLVSGFDPPMIVVYEINGLWWRDPSGPPLWFGSWVHRNASGSTFVHCPTDSLDWLEFPAGCMMGMGMMFPDSIWSQIIEVYPDSLPKPDSSFFAGYHVDIFNPLGGGMMGNMMMRFFKDIEFHLHYDDGELANRGLAEEGLAVWYCDSDSLWKPVSGAVIDTKNNTLVFSQRDTRTYYALSASPITSMEDAQDKTPKAPQGYILSQNYPNPFNPTTTITYFLPMRSKVSIEIFNLLGQKIRTLIDRTQEAGHHTLQWDGRDKSGSVVSSGIYLYRLRANGFTFTRKMILIQ